MFKPDNTGTDSFGPLLSGSQARKTDLVLNEVSVCLRHHKILYSYWFLRIVSDRMNTMKGHDQLWIRLLLCMSSFLSHWVSRKRKIMKEWVVIWLPSLPTIPLAHNFTLILVTQVKTRRKGDKMILTLYIQIHSIIILTKLKLIRCILNLKNINIKLDHNVLYFYLSF